MHTRVIIRNAAVLGAAVALAVSCGSDGGPTGLPIPEQSEGAPVAIVNARVLTMTSSELHHGWTVLVQGGRIVAVGPASEVTVPNDADVVNAHSHVLMPGLADMHVHVKSRDLRAYARHGVTTVRNMWGFAALASFTERSGSALIPDSAAAPMIYSTSPGVDRAPPKWPETRIIASANDADDIVLDLRTEGWDAIKLYSSLTKADYDSLVAAAQRNGLDAVGHVPFAISIEHALASGQRSVEHLGGYDRAASGGRVGATAWAFADPNEMRRLAELTRASATWNCPTTVVLETFLRSAPAETRAAAASGMRAAIRALHEAGAPLLAGTDAGIDLTAPGTSLVSELEQFVGAGLSPYDAIRTATVDAAEFLRERGEFGEIRSGARADLILVAGNPLEDVRRLSSPALVMVRGRWVR